jgi:hypothetical protein
MRFELNGLQKRAVVRLEYIAGHIQSVEANETTITHGREMIV